MNDEVKEAFSISDNDKKTALELFEKAVTKLVRKDYVMAEEDALTELSAIFGVSWICTYKTNDLAFFSAKMYSLANIAFNYANIKLGMKRKFIQTAKRLVEDNERVSDLALESMADDLDYLLTFTKADEGVIMNYM